jgi:hypothetical protein
MADKVNQFLGDTPLRTAVKLAILSVIVGIIMAALNYTPIDLWYALRDFVRWLYDLGYEAFGRLGMYFVYGAMVVLPVFLLSRLLSSRRR